MAAELPKSIEGRNPPFIGFLMNLKIIYINEPLVILTKGFLLKS
jgi:hypothetical protein